MSHRRLGIPFFALAATVFAGSVALAPMVGAAGNGSTRLISASGSTYFHPTAEGAAVTGIQKPEIARGPGGAGDASGTTGASSKDSGVNRSKSESDGSGSTSNHPSTQGRAESDNGAQVVTSFNGLNHRNQRLANGGNQFSVEPPDQGLCAGNGFVFEIVNDVMKVFHTDGSTALATEDSNTFFGYAAQFDRTLGLEGPFVTDPSCYYDKTTNRWFVDVLTLEVFSDTGDFTGVNHLDLAVSNGGDPTTATWKIYRVQVQDDGHNGTPNHGCTGLHPPLYGNLFYPPNFPNACLGDYPHLGADANGIFLTTNEYSFFGNDFHGAQIYAFSKTALAAGSSTVGVTQLDTHGMDNGNSGFTVWPAVAPADLNSTANGGTEYFMSSNAGDEAHGNGASVGPRRSNQLLVWSLTHTSSLNSSSPNVSLSHKTLRVGTYTVPERSVQKTGSTPLRDCINNTACSTFLLGGPNPFAPESEYRLDSNDSRMQQVVYANGKLWGALDTGVRESENNTQAAVEWFVVSTNGSPKLANSGYFAAENANVIYPAISVAPNGQGVMAFTLTGENDFPSAAFTTINADGTGDVQVAAHGLGPADGFSGYAVFNAPNPARPRWGDYGSAVYDAATGNIWIASEYIGQTCTFAQYTTSPFGSCGGTRTTLANWYTRITEVRPAGE